MAKAHYIRNTTMPDTLEGIDLSQIVGNLSTIENIDNINEANNGVKKYAQRYGSWRWSPNNPYGNQIPYAYDSDHAHDLADKAMEWESNFGDALLARQFQLQDRAHDEEYNSPAAQIARERAAGRNPDIQDAMTIATDSGQAPTPSPTSNDSPSSVERKEADLDAAQTVIGGTATLANVVLSALNFAQGVPIANEQIQGLQLANAHQQQVNDSFNTQQFLQSVPVASMFADSALSLAGDTPFSMDHVTQALAGTPYAKDEGFGRFVYNLAQSPEMKARVLSSLDDFDMASAMRTVKGQMNFAEKIAQGEIKLKLVQNDVSIATQNNELTYQKALEEMKVPVVQASAEESEFALKEQTNNALIDQGVPEDNAVTQKSRNSMIRKSVQDALLVYNRAIGEVANQIYDMDRQIAALEKKGYLTPTERTTLTALRISRQKAYVYGAEQWTQCQLSYRNFCYDALRYTVGTTPSLEGRNTPNWFERTLFGKKKDIDFLNMTFDKRLEYGDDFDMVGEFMKIFPLVP